MEIKQKEKELFNLKKTKLNNIRKTLKSEYFGIDNIIDEVIDNLESWYIFPKYSQKPKIINLWGMTGVGKTSLINRIIELLEINEKYYKFDLSQENGLKNRFIETIVHNQGNSPVILFDEFQNIKTINEENKEIEKSSTNIIWELLDSGKINILPNSYSRIYGIISFYERLLEFTNNNHIEVKNGIVVGGNTEQFKNEFYNHYNEEIKSEQLFLVPTNIHFEFSYLFSDVLGTDMMRSKLRKLNLYETLNLIEKGINKSKEPITYDYSDSLIFIAGNLDELYRFSSNMNPDIDCDLYHEKSKLLTITDVKKSLLKRFRSEQISRLGNNHIIYPALSSKNYKDIINYNLNNFKEFFKEKFDIEIYFKDSVKNIIYNESVFPLQGTRPILSTIENNIKSLTSEIISDIYEKDHNIDSIKWIYDDENFYIDFISNEKIIFTKNYKVKIKTNKLREPKKDDRQSLVSLHESGHIVASIFSLNICPKNAYSNTANNDGGFTTIIKPEWTTFNLIKNDIITKYGGYVAEKLIFGEEKLSTGSVSDISSLSSLAKSLYTDLGMIEKTPYKIGNQKLYNQTITKELKNVKLENLLEVCYNECINIIKNNETLLLKLTEYLIKNNKIEENKIKEFTEKYSNWDVPKWKTKDNYHGFKNIIENKLKNLKTNDLKIDTKEVNSISLNIKK